MLNIVIITGLLIAQIPSAQGQRIDADVCRNALHEEIQKEHAIFRGVVFGVKKAEEAGIGEVRIDFIDRAWYKVAENEWRSTAVDFPFTDFDMDAQTPGGNRRGFFETRGVLTSNLIPYIGQSMRAFQCNLSLICDQQMQSMNYAEDVPQNITVSALGCIKKDVETFPECHFANKKTNLGDQADTLGYCPKIVEEMLEQEAGIISMAISYDAAYRTVLQFAGNFDLFLQEFRLPLISTLRDVINLIGGLNRIPCFVASCDAYPPLAP
ncbi:MAG: hypothetical protein O2904_01855 [bacterium]|nr:hypothetical protein [bacterium]